MSAAPDTLGLDIAVRQGGFSMELQWEGPAGVLGLTGPSGSGKTTVVEVIAGLRRLTRGHVRLGAEVFEDTARRLWRPPRERRVGYAPQDAALFPHLSVRANVLYGADRAAETPLGEVLEMLEIEALAGRGVPGLSGGERQRVALARALLSGPALLLLDEPLSAVDLARRRRILPRLAEWARARGLATVHVSHDESELAGADHVLALSD